MKFKIFGVSFRRSRANKNTKQPNAESAKREVELVDFNVVAVKSAADIEISKNAAKSNQNFFNEIPDSKLSNDTPTDDLAEYTSAQVYNSLSSGIESAENREGMLQRYPERLSEASPLRGGLANGDFTDDLFPAHISSQTRRRTKRWAVFLCVTVISIMIILGITSVALEYIKSHPENSTAITVTDAFTNISSENASTLFGNVEDIDDITGYTLANSQDLKAQVEYPIPDVKTRAEREFRKEVLTDFSYTVPKSNLQSVPISESRDKTEYDIIPFIIPLPLLKMANKSALEDGLRVGQEALDQRQRTEIRIHQLGFSIPSGAPEAYSQYHSHSNDSMRQAQENETNRMSLIGFSMDRASRIIAKRLNLTKEEALQGIPTTSDGQVDVKPTTWCAEQREQSCNLSSVYRSFDGSCNNLNHALWGAILQPYRRILLPDYADGISRPRSGKDGIELPNARYISEMIFKNKHQDDPMVSMMFALWAEFIEHDMDHTVQSAGETPIPCCENGTLLEIQHPECFPIYMETEDPLYHHVSRHCMTVLRSAAAPSCTFGPREQFSKTTPFIDGSTIYGSSSSEPHWVRGISSNNSGGLEMSTTADGQTVLSPLVSPDDYCNTADEIRQDHYCFKSGDDRVNLNLGLTSMHLIWTRQHNLVAKELSALNPHWEDEEIFQESRRIVIAQMQHISFNEYIPLHVGPELVESADLKLLEKGYYEGYNKLINPGISNGFSAGASYFRHSMIQGLTELVGPPGKKTHFIQTHELFFNPFPLWTLGNLESILRGFATAAAAKVDTSFTEQVTNHLFQARNKSYGYDLPAIDIQQGRDHGLPGYSAWRKICGLESISNFTDLHSFWNGSAVEMVEQIYKSVADIDLLVGGLAETPVSGGVVGPTFACILADQFSRIRKGDRFWYEGNIQLKPFTLVQLDEIRQTTLAGILCDNTDGLQSIQARALQQISTENTIRSCEEISRKFNYTLWKESEPIREIGLDLDALQDSGKVLLNNNSSGYEDAEEKEEYDEVRTKFNYSALEHHLSPFENVLDKHGNLSTTEASAPSAHKTNVSTTELEQSTNSSVLPLPVADLQLLTNLVNDTEIATALPTVNIDSTKEDLVTLANVQRNDSNATKNA